MIENDASDWKARRCGHNFPIRECPYRRCSARSLYEALSLAIDHLEEMRNDDTWHPVGDCPVLNRATEALSDVAAPGE
jgi:hypothetical protein